MHTINVMLDTVHVITSYTPHVFEILLLLWMDIEMTTYIVLRRTTELPL